MHLHKSNEYQNLKLVFKLFLIIPFSIVLCERLFSHMNQIKNEYGSKLLNSNLENLLFLCLYKNHDFDYKHLSRIILQQWK